MVTFKQGESGSPFPFDEDRLIDNVEEDSHEGNDDLYNNDDNACCRAL